MTVQIVRQYLGRLAPFEKPKNDKGRAQELFERAAQFRSMARDILSMADEAESEAMVMVGATLDDLPSKGDYHIWSKGSFADFAKHQYRSRRMRERYFDKKIFGEPGWDMLLELYAGEIKDENISTSNLVLSSSAPNSTALRWIKHLEDVGLITKKSSHLDGRVQYQRMTKTGFDGMTEYFDAISGK
ncbi:MAG TPA: hypothetical protein VNS79_03950 [Sphingobium sp.]|nr:hypothetical protein [Sphingobium sp.]